MQIGIIGTGSVGTALATGLSTVGHDVVLGSRTPEMTSVADLPVESQRAAAETGEVVVLALPAAPAIDVAADLASVLAGKPVLDAANEYPEPTADRSLADRIAAAAPEAHVVKAFNTIGANLMRDPVVEGERATMFLAGDDPTALETAETLARDLGFDPLVAGGLSRADHLEDLARLWIHLSRDHGRNIAFRLLRE